MNSVPKMILTIVLILACLGYTVYNYLQGRAEPAMLVVAFAILGFPLINIVRGLIDALRK